MKSTLREISRLESLHTHIIECLILYHNGSNFKELAHQLEDIFHVQVFQALQAIKQEEDKDKE